ncbi:alanine/glycine:cation symporter family protein [Klebsiella sp. 2680]|uniref:alanine/glycine:cation symporter family protein n=1 Tax=Klebsiella sp. 2680 TaxID=2018037 RepID=UPI0011585498|nr:sodium:alanine symporter family protein [Klebsiella sp. 2680]
MPDFLFFINEILWGSVMIYLLLGAGAWFTWRTKFIPFRCVHQFSQGLKKSLASRPGGVTSFQALCTGMAARIGSGNLAGVALAITAGGPGAVFWMWISALLGMASSFAECSLAQLYKERDARGQFRGGPAWYMARGLGMRWMGVLFSILLLLAYGTIFNTVQANSVAYAMKYAFHAPEIVTGCVLAILILLVIVRGIRGVARLLQWFVPLLAMVWILTSLVISLWHIDELPTVFATIFRSAFGWQEAAAGAVGYTISQALTSGFQRGMFSHEAGMGSTPNVAAAAATWPSHPATQGLVQMIGVFIDTVVICTASAVIIMLAPRNDNSAAINGIQALQLAMNNLVGDWGAGFVAFIMLLFAFSAIIANYIYAENNLVFLRMDSRRNIWALRFLALSMVIAGTVISLPVAWQMADIVMALMAITNLTAILLLSPTVRIITDDYLRQRRLGTRPEFDVTRYPEIHQQVMSGIWDNLPRK